MYIYKHYSLVKKLRSFSVIIFKADCYLKKDWNLILFLLSKCLNDVVHI